MDSNIHEREPLLSKNDEKMTEKDPQTTNSISEMSKRKGLRGGSSLFVNLDQTNKNHYYES